MLKNLLINFLMVLGICVVLLLVLILRPVPQNVAEEEALVVSGEVTHIYEAGVKDAVFILKDNPVKYYINRGLANGLDLADLKQSLLGKEVTIKYPQYWTPLVWNGTSKHISKLEVDDQVVFKELR